MKNIHIIVPPSSAKEGYKDKFSIGEGYLAERVSDLQGLQVDLSVLLEKDQSVISRHIKNIFQDNEVAEKSNMQKMYIPIHYLKIF